MKTRPTLWWLAALVLVAGGFGRGVSARHWQYKTCSLGDPHEPCELNAMGAQGWELVAATPFTWNDGTAGARVFLKREIP
jgi:hypothetical protein